MMIIAKYTTPGITYKPSMVEVANIDKIFLVIKQNGCAVIEKDISDATVAEDMFVWKFTQEESGKLCEKLPTTVQIDYMSGADRYTTNEISCAVVKSAIPEVIE